MGGGGGALWTGHLGFVGSFLVWHPLPDPTVYPVWFVVVRAHILFFTGGQHILVKRICKYFSRFLDSESGQFFFLTSGSFERDGQQGDVSF